MDILFDLPDIIKNSERRATQILLETRKIPHEETILRANSSSDSGNLLYHGDNIDVISDLLHRGYGKRLDLIYIDPPFFTLANYNNRVAINFQDKKEIIEYTAYTDTWKGGFNEYLEMLATRLILMKELLSDRGSIYVHIDFRTVHYIKVIMDYIFGVDNFLNEVIWSYKSGGTSKKHFSRKHDNILVYTRTKNYIFNPQKEKSYNRGYKPYRFKGVMEYEDTLGWYTLVNLKDVWQMDMVGRTSGERVGYETQKPESLLERIILSSTVEGSIVADFFSGSGTTIAVAEKHNRNWIGSDIGNSSILTIMKRLGAKNSKSYKKIELLKTTNISDIIIKPIEVEATSQSINITIELEKYILDLSLFKFKKSDNTLITNILEQDSLSLIDYISISQEAETSTVIYENYRTKDNLPINPRFSFTTQNLNSHIYINVIDIFGNTMRQKLNLREDD